MGEANMIRGIKSDRMNAILVLLVAICSAGTTHATAGAPLQDREDIRDSDHSRELLLRKEKELGLFDQRIVVAEKREEVTRQLLKTSEEILQLSKEKLARV